jgi:hypothetical protein
MISFKYIPKFTLLVFVINFMTSNTAFAQCNSCTVVNPASGGNYTIPSGNTACFSTNTTLNKITFSDNSKLCVSPGVQLTINNNVQTPNNGSIEISIQGTLQLNQSPDIRSDIILQIAQTGVFKLGTSGNNNIKFSGKNENRIENSGSIQAGVIDFQHNQANQIIENNGSIFASSNVQMRGNVTILNNSTLSVGQTLDLDNGNTPNLIENNGTLSVSGSVNIQGDTVIQNTGTAGFGSSFNNNSNGDLTFINCGTANFSGNINSGNGKFVNTNILNVSGTFSLTNHSELDNYGTINVNSNFNAQNQSIVYNEGLIRLQGNNSNINGWLKGPETGKLGFFESNHALGTNNQTDVGPNLDFKRTNASSTSNNIFMNGATFVDYNRNSSAQSTVNVTFDCNSNGSCLYQNNTSLSECPNNEGLFSDLKVTYSTDNNTPAPNDIITITISAENLGPADNDNVNVLSLLPDGYNFVNSNTTKGTYNEISGTWSLGNLNNGDSETLTITASVNNTGNYDINVNVTGNVGDNVISNNMVTATVSPTVTSNMVTQDFESGDRNIDIANCWGFGGFSITDSDKINEAYSARSGPINNTNGSFWLKSPWIEFDNGDVSFDIKLNNNDNSQDYYVEISFIPFDPNDNYFEGTPFSTIYTHTLTSPFSDPETVSYAVPNAIANDGNPYRVRLNVYSQSSNTNRRAIIDDWTIAGVDVSDSENGCIPQGVSLPDSDGDGIADADDIDDDNDGIPDALENATATNNGDTDGDGIPDSLDLDSDGDGILDIVESGDSNAVDNDNDGRVDGLVGANGLLDNAETSPESGALANGPEDTDSDGTADFQDADSDNDGISDLVEGGTDPALDNDNNGIIDVLTDNDSDGIANDVDPDNGGILAGTPDTDNDGTPDYRDLDSDNDGKNDVKESGLTDSDENAQVDTPGTLAVGNALPDEDANGTSDFREPPVDLADSPLTSDQDGNNDGIIDNDTDTDGDGIADEIDDLPNEFGDALPVVPVNEVTQDFESGDRNIDIANCWGFGGFSIKDNDKINGSFSARSGSINTTNGAFWLKSPWIELESGNVSFDIKLNNNDNSQDYYVEISFVPFDANDTYFEGTPFSTVYTHTLTSPFSTPETVSYAVPNAIANDGNPYRVRLSVYSQSANMNRRAVIDDWSIPGVDVSDPNNGCIPLTDDGNGNNTDSDGDGISDATDLDDDNDGILDVNEQQSTNSNVTSIANGTVEDENSVTNSVNAEGNADGNHAKIEGWGSYLVLDFGEVFPAGTSYAITWKTDWGEPAWNQPSTMFIGESTINNSFVDHSSSPSTTSNSNYIITTITSENAFRYLKIYKKDNVDHWRSLLVDAIEVTSVQNENTYSDIDTDGDGIADRLDLDSDNDGIPDIIEAGGTDADGNGFADDLTDTNNDGFADIFDTNLGGATLADLDTDADGIENRLDLDSDDDGIPDNIEAQTTYAYQEPNGVDSDNDGIDDTYDVDCNPCGSIFGHAIRPVNSDGIDEPDYLDTDSDNDGVPDIDEAFTSTPSGTQGANGLYSDAETSDDYSDVNGSAFESGNFTLIDSDNDVPNGADYDYRDIPMTEPLYGTHIISSLSTGVVTPNKIDAYLNIVAKNWGVVITRVNGVNSIVNPVEGMLVFDTSDNSFKVCIDSDTTMTWRPLKQY